MQTKQCTTCGTTKPLSEFSKDKQRKGGLRHRCKQCHNENQKNYRNSLQGLFTELFARQNSASIERGHNPPTHTKEQFIIWIQGQPKFNQLYINWVNSKYLSDLKPSVDRLDNNIGYVFNNMQVITWAENRSKQ